MDNLTMCQQFSLLTHMYTISFICSNYNIYCDDYCQNDINDSCYCYCSNDNIYCYSRYYYYSKLFFVLFVAILFSVLCTCCFSYLRNFRTNTINNNNINNNNLPKYDDLMKK